MSKWLLVDGYNIAFRSFYALPPTITRSDGLPTNAVLGFLKTLFYLQDKEHPDHMIVFFDLGPSKKRKELLPSYKANRQVAPDAFKTQIPFIKQLTTFLGLGPIEKEGIEADDLIAASATDLAKHKNEVYIVSADKDFAQCIQPGISQLLPPPTAQPKLGWRTLDASAVYEKFGVKPNQIVDHLALMGDSSDNIPGIQGVGPKTATKWLSEYETIEKILEKTQLITPTRFQAILKESKDLLEKNKQMLELDRAHPANLSAIPKKNINALKSLLTELEMHAALKELDKRYPSQQELLL